MRQIAYFSTAFEPQTSALIHDILTCARTHNHRHDISGILVAGRNRYMQIIEGPSVALDQLYRNIQDDSRHLAITKLFRRLIIKRSFDGWDMAYRHEPKLDQFDSFPTIVRYLTEQVEDDALRIQIRKFTSTFIPPLHNPGPALWAPAL